MTRLAFLLVRSQGVAEELAHDAFVRLYERIDTVENPPAFIGRLRPDPVAVDPDPDVVDTAALDRVRPAR